MKLLSQLPSAIRRIAVVPLFLLAALASSATVDSGSPAPLPDAATLLRQVQANQKQLDKAREDYTYRATQTVREIDKAGNVKKVETEEHEVFFINGHRVEKLVAKNSKPLSTGDAQKEQDRVNKEALKYAQPGQEDDKKDDITVSRLLDIIVFSHPRRTLRNGRSTIVYDFAGDPNAKTHGKNEDALKKTSGTLWIDESDREVSRLSAVLNDDYHVGFGLLASVAKGSNVVFDQALVRNEAWLPTAVDLHLQAKAFLVFGLRADVTVRFDEFRKFQTNAVQQPGAHVVPN